MEDEVSQVTTGADGSSRQAPPPPPDPNGGPAVNVIDPAFDAKSDEPLVLSDDRWDITSISSLAALRMLVIAMEALAEATGDVPPTPPVSRPSTPRNAALLSPPETSDYPAIPIGSPEAHPHEPIIAIGANAEEHYIQHAAIARRFFSKVAPPFSLSEYLLRLHKYCAHSPGVYLTASAYLYRLCVGGLMVPATSRTVHRLSLAAIRVGAKALEDNKWSQDRVAKVGGVNKLQLMNLEVTLCFLLDFDLWVDADILAKRMFLLQQAGRQGVGTRERLNETFKLKLPSRKKLLPVFAAP